MTTTGSSRPSPDGPEEPAGDGHEALRPLHVDPAETVYENAHQVIRRVRAHFREGARDLYVTDYGERVGMVVERDGQILLTRQYRLLIDRVSWEIPGGRVDPGERLEEAAVRECFEETGVRCVALRPLITFQPGLDTLHNPTTVFTGEVEAEAERPAGHERTLVAWVPRERVLKMVRASMIVDSLSLVALLAYLGPMRS
ncbi:MAG: NUDIX hydrolase [Dehalococcoidia bacterium]